MKTSILFLLCLSFTIAKTQPISHSPAKPKLVIGIVVDQMRQEYLYRYYPKFGKGGFKRLMNEGFMLKNAHYNYIPTSTGPGHASIYTGTTPAHHGIAGNSWYDRDSKKMVNCVDDDRQKVVGGNKKGNRAASPWRMIATTITDELELATQRRAKVVGISFKDRGAALPAGHTPDGAYWYDFQTGNFITSSYYRKTLPTWLKHFNSLNLANQYLNSTWDTFYPIEQYEESGPDDSPYEAMGENTRLFFPYSLQQLRKKYGNFKLLPLTPFGNDLLTQLAFAAIEGENMGEDQWTDFLAISYSSTDMLGHAMGPNSVELEDMYIRLDKNLERLLEKMDENIGKGQYLVFLTSDHGVADVEAYARDLGMVPQEGNQLAELEDSLEHFLKQYNRPMSAVVEKIADRQIYLGAARAGEEKPPLGGDYKADLLHLIKSYLLRQTGIADVFTAEDLRASCFNEQGNRGMVKRGFHRRRSGDIAFVMEQGLLGSKKITGTSHGTGYAYDTHVPILLYGHGIKHGSTAAYHPITDIAPTLSVLLEIKMPSNTTGSPITELWGD